MTSTTSVFYRKPRPEEFVTKEEGRDWPLTENVNGDLIMGYDHTMPAAFASVANEYLAAMGAADSSDQIVADDVIRSWVKIGDDDANELSRLEFCDADDPLAAPITYVRL